MTYLVEKCLKKSNKIELIGIFFHFQELLQVFIKNRFIENKSCYKTIASIGLVSFFSQSLVNVSFSANNNGLRVSKTRL